MVSGELAHLVAQTVAAFTLVQAPPCGAGMFDFVFWLTVDRLQLRERERALRHSCWGDFLVRRSSTGLVTWFALTHCHDTSVSPMRLRLLFGFVERICVDFGHDTGCEGIISSVLARRSAGICFQSATDSPSLRLN